MIAHQRIGVDRALFTLGALAQCPQIRRAVHRAGETSRAFASALHDVQRGVGFLRAGEARHGTPNNAAGCGAVDAALGRQRGSYRTGMRTCINAERPPRTSLRHLWIAAGTASGSSTLSP